MFSFNFSHAFDFIPELFPRVRQDQANMLQQQLEAEKEKQKQQQTAIITGIVVFGIILLVIVIVKSKLNQ